MFATSRKTLLDWESNTDLLLSNQSSSEQQHAYYIYVERRLTSPYDTPQTHIAISLLGHWQGHG